MKVDCSVKEVLYELLDIELVLVFLMRVYIGVGDEVGKVFQLEVGVKVVSTKMSKIKSM